MKKTIFTMFLLLTLGLFSATAYAWWSVSAHARVNPERVHVQVRNNYNRPIYCEVMAFGRTRSGQVLRSSTGGVLYPGRVGGAYVYTSWPNTFVNGWGRARCRWY